MLSPYLYSSSLQNLVYISGKIHYKPSKGKKAYLSHDYKPKLELIHWLMT